MFSVLVIDDDPGVNYMLCRIAQDEGHVVVSAQTLAEGLRHIRDREFDCVFLDIYLPDGNGLEALPVIKLLASPPEVIIITGQGDPEGAELAIKNGAWSYIQKSSSIEQIALIMDQVGKYRQRRKDSRPIVLKRGKLIGESAAMTRVLEAIAQAASSHASVLLTGETGTGKELVARTIHENSARASREFVVVDCAALPHNLGESILFGHVKGAFTGADGAREGLVKVAHGGTLFLDEVGELPLETQKIFLRVLQERTFRPVGARQEDSSNFRLIAATNRDLEQMTTQGTFRSDLLFRLKSFVIDLPPLRARREDIKALVLSRLEQLCASYDIPVKGVAPEVLDIFQRYDWPGNVRELVQYLERVLVAANDAPMLFPEHLPLELRAYAARQSVQPLPSRSEHPVASSSPAAPLPTFKAFRKAAVSEAEREYLLRLLENAGGSIKRACAIADLSRTRLYNLMKEHEISRRYSSSEDSDIA